MRQSFAKIERENQNLRLAADQEPSFDAWVQEPGAWGGRAPNAEASTMLSPRDAGPCEGSIRDWVTKSEECIFSTAPPPHLVEDVQEILTREAVSQAHDNVKLHLSELSARAAPILSMQSPDPAVRMPALAPAWTIGPDQSWFQTPVSSRPPVGHTLLGRLTQQSRGHEPLQPSVSYKFDTWSSPFTVCYLNVGRRHLIGSLQAVVALVLKHRPDILFLGDLVTSRNHIGRLKKQLARDLDDEWFLTSNISSLPGRPVGVGALIHCSLANHVTDCIVPAPRESDKNEWEAATGG